MGIETAALVGMGVAGLGGALSGNRANAQNKRAQQAQNRQIQQQVGGMMQGGPTAAEQGLAQLLKSRMGTGTDSMMQSMNRSGQSGTAANTAVDGFLTQLLGGGQGFDNTAMFRALQTQDATNVNDQVAGLRGGMGNLGRRFGSASGVAEALLRERAAASSATRNAGIASTSFESNAGRQLQAAGLLSGREQFAQNFGLQERQIGQNDFSQLLSGYGQLGQLGQSRTGQNAQLLSLLAGQPVGQSQPNQLWDQLGQASTLPFLRGLQGGMRLPTQGQIAGAWNPNTFLGF